MSQHPFPSSRLWSTLLVLDLHAADEVRALGCPLCEGRLHSARYPRKPRGIDRSVLEAEYLLRESFCCAECRRRTTPPSLRFLGRKVYLGALLVLFGNSGGDGAPTKGFLRRTAASTGIPARTLERWHQWWTETVPPTRWWRELSPLFSPPVQATTLPTGMLTRVAGAGPDGRLIALLALLGPLTTRTCSHFPRVHTDTHEWV